MTEKFSTLVLVTVEHDGKRTADDLAEHVAQRAYTLDHVSSTTGRAYRPAKPSYLTPNPQVPNARY